MMTGNPGPHSGIRDDEGAEETAEEGEGGLDPDGAPANGQGMRGLEQCMLEFFVTLLDHAIGDNEF